MSLLKKKLSFFYSAFFSSIFIVFASSAYGDVICRGFDRSETVSRNQIASGGGGSSERAFTTGSKAMVGVLNGSIDLNISLDAESFAHGIVTETTGFIWQVTSRSSDNVTGFITADYQFNGLVNGDNKICNGPTSCIQVLDITPISTQHAHRGNGTIRRARERIRIRMDVTGVTNNGTHVGNLQMQLFNGPNADGSGRVNLNCDRIR